MNKIVILYGLLLIIASMVIGSATPIPSPCVLGNSTTNISGVSVYCNDIMAVYSDMDTPPTLPDDQYIPTSEPAIEKLSILRLQKGWNLVSFPYFHSTLEGNGFKIFEDLCGDGITIYSYDSKSNANWKKMNLADASKFPNNGFWIKSNKDCTIKTNGMFDISLEGRKLSAGWNLIASPDRNSQSSYQFSRYMGNCQVLSGPWGYNALATRYEKSQDLTIGKGYLVRVAKECTLNEINPPNNFPTNKPSTYPTYSPTYQPTAISEYSIPGKCTSAKGPKQLIVDLRFDEGSGDIALDSSGGIAGKIINPIWVSGKSQGALKFEKNSYVIIPANSRLTLGSEYTIEAYIMPTAEFGASTYETILSKEHEYILRFANGHDEKGMGRILSSIDFGAGINQHANAYLPGFKYTGGNYAGHETGDINFIPGTWYKVAMDYDGEFLSLKVDDRIISRTRTTRSISSGYYDLNIGGHAGGYDRFAGLIDEVKIWSSPVNCQKSQITTQTNQRVIPKASDPQIYDPIKTLVSILTN